MGGPGRAYESVCSQEAWDRDRGRQQRLCIHGSVSRRCRGIQGMLHLAVPVASRSPLPRRRWRRRPAAAAAAAVWNKAGMGQWPGVRAEVIRGIGGMLSLSRQWRSLDAFQTAAAVWNRMQPPHGASGPRAAAARPLLGLAALRPRLQR